MTPNVDEFIRRFLIPVLPKGFHRIRHYGLFASSNRAAVRNLLNLAPPAAEETAAEETAAEELQPRRRARPIRHSPSHTLALVAAAACSSSKLLSPAASRVIGRPHLPSQSGSAPHDREHNLSHHRARLRWSSTGNVAAWPASPLGDFRPILR
jgi:hypothetical protein